MLYAVHSFIFCMNPVNWRSLGLLRCIAPQNQSVDCNSQLLTRCFPNLNWNVKGFFSSTPHLHQITLATEWTACTCGIVSIATTYMYHAHPHTCKCWENYSRVFWAQLKNKLTWFGRNIWAYAQNHLDMKTQNIKSPKNNLYIVSMHCIMS